MEGKLLMAILVGMVLLLIMILRLKWPAFIALLIAAITTGLVAGMDPALVMDAIKTGMGGTLGFVATVVGLGAIFGGILEHTRGSQALAGFLLRVIGEQRAPLALMITGLLVAIPIFFDVGFIILFPIVVALHRKTGRSVLFYALPLLSGLAVSHAFIPPTPGPLAVADILGAPLGMVVLIGAIAGVPAAVAGLLYSRWLANRLYIEAPEPAPTAGPTLPLPGIGWVLPILLLPILLIVFHTLFDAKILSTGAPRYDALLTMLCHPFSALILANLLAWYGLGRRAGLTQTQLADISGRSLAPAGIILLVTGAGGVFKQILVDTGAGEMLAKTVQDAGLGLVSFAFLAAALIRILQGSATVAMITGAGLVAPLLPAYDLAEVQRAALVIAIASGGTVASHLNDSGFWLVKEFLGLSEKDGMRSWTGASTCIGLMGYVMAMGVYAAGRLV
jgi:Gnt-I system low-affinity gluconate transporter